MSTTDTEENSEELREKIAELRSDLSSKALHLVNVVMPRKVLHLDEMYNKQGQLTSAFKTVRQPIDLDDGLSGDASSDVKLKKRKLILNSADSPAPTSAPGSTPAATPPPLIQEVPCNKAITVMIVDLKKEILELIETINCVKIWIQLNIPKIEDGNNFGVSIQEDTVAELGRAEDSGYAVLDNVSKYFVRRAKLVSKVLKTPHIADYHQAVMELDEEKYVSLQLCMLDLRNNYAILHDMITKNLDKIKTPRRSDHLASIF